MYLKMFMHKKNFKATLTMIEWILKSSYFASLQYNFPLFE